MHGGSFRGAGFPGLCHSLRPRESPDPDLAGVVAGGKLGRITRRRPAMTEQEPRRRLISQSHRRRSLRSILLPLAVLIAVIVLLPKLVALLD